MNLRSVQSVGNRPSVDRDYVTFHLPGTLKFPALTMTETNKMRGGQLVNFQTTRAYGTFKINEGEFSLSPKADHVILNCSFASGVDTIRRNWHLRICEALGFALGEFVIPFAIALEPHRGEHVEILRAPKLKYIRPGRKQEIPRVTECKFCKPQSSKSSGTAFRRFCISVIRLSWRRSTMKVHEQITHCPATLASNGSVGMASGRKLPSPCVTIS